MRWSKREDSILEKMAEYYPIELIQKRFRHLGYYRTIDSIKGRADRLGISLNPTLDYISCKRAAPLIGVHHSTVSRWVSKQLLPAMRRSPRHLSIRMEDIRNFILNPPDNWQIKNTLKNIPPENRKYIFDDYE